MNGLSHSQETPDIIEDIPESEKTEISYFRLNELWKYVEYKHTFADSTITFQNLQIRYLDSVNQIRGLKLEQYEDFAIPALEGRIRVKDSTIKNQNEKFGLKEIIYKSEIKKQKGKKWNFGVYGVVLGALITLGSIILFGGI